MVVHKKSLILFVITLCVVIAGSYGVLTWWASHYPEEEIDVLNPVESTNPNLIQPQIDEIIEDDEDGEENFFIEYRLKRERARSQRIDILSMVINNPNTAPEVRVDAQRELERIAQLTETEMIVENLLTAKGFEDALLFWHEDSVNVIIKSQELSQKEAIQIRDIVARALKTPMEEVVIIEK